MKFLPLILILFSCETEMEKQARINDRKCDSLARQLQAETNQYDREIRLIESKSR